MSTIPDTHITPLDDIDILKKLTLHPYVLPFVLKLTDSDKLFFKKMLKWSKSLTANILNETNVIRFLNKLSDEDLTHFVEFSSCSSAMKSNLSQSIEIVKFISNLDQNQLTSFDNLIDWSPTLLSRFRDNLSHLSSFYNVWDLVDDKNNFAKTYFNIMDHPNSKWCNAIDAFTKGQISSKIWLINTLKNKELPLGKVWTLCGWVGTLSYFMLMQKNQLKIQHIRSFDIDNFCHVLADTLNRKYVIDNWAFKASTLDVNNISYDDFIFETTKYDGTIEKVQDSADTIINTSCDHMGQNNEWFEKIPKNKLIVLQNNNWYDNDQHDNSVSTLKDFKKMYPMNDIIFEGVLDCDIYDRYMIIGKK